MFDIGFTELLLIAVITLVVVGPQRLPDTIRTTALWIGRIRRAASRAYREVEKEVGMDDIRRQLHNEEILRSLRKEEHEKPAETVTDPKPDSGSPDKKSNDS